MQLTVHDDPIDLEGTQAIECRLKGAAPTHRFAQLRHKDRVCGAVIERTQQGDNTIAMDKYLRTFLQVRTGDAIDIEFRDFPPAQEIAITLSAEQPRDAIINLVRDSLVGKPVCKGQSLPVYASPLTGEDQIGEIRSVDPAEIALVTRATRLVLGAGKVSKVGVTYTSIGGLGREIQQIREIIEFPFRHPEVFRTLGITPPRGIILYGPPGTGKTLISKGLAHEVGASVFTIHGPEIISGWYGGSEENLRNVFEQARQQAPAIVVIDEIDSIAPRRDRTQGEVEHRVVATLLTLMDGMTDLNRVAVIGTTNSINSIDPALRRPGRFEHEIHIGVPDLAGRKEILTIHTRRMPIADVDLDQLAEQCHGFVGADLASLSRQAAYCALRRVHKEQITDLDTITNLAGMTITQDDFQTALKSIKPSAMREVVVEVPRDVTWDSVGGLDEVKQILIENVVGGIKNRQAFAAVGIKPAQGVLLYGPPGTGKTLLAKVVARESSANFIAVRGPEVKSKWFGESEERVRLLFAKAREVAPCIILLDELDALAGVRGGLDNRTNDSIVNQFLAEMDGLNANDNVFVIGTTNQLSLIDPALLRPGRFDYQVQVPAPDESARANIYRVHLKGKPDSGAIDVAALAARSDGLSGADIAEVCRLATLDALRANQFNPTNVKLTMESFDNALKGIKKTHKTVGFP